MHVSFITLRSLPAHLPYSQPPPSTPHQDDNADSAMSGILGFLKTILTPALISLFLYMLFSYILLPIYRTHRSRYQSYIPLPTSLTSTTDNLRQRLSSFLNPSSQRQRNTYHSTSSESESEGLFSEEEGEGMVRFEISEGRREALAREGMLVGTEGDGRLSRDLEEGFRDDSDEEVDMKEDRLGRPT
ncbi:MAG: hypothetical protein M1835_003033 [Candelina submexicana]|nr:MAG: hypothetical protein M1835_003033 [Candelina submexicana]